MVTKLEAGVRKYGSKVPFGKYMLIDHEGQVILTFQRKKIGFLSEQKLPVKGKGFQKVLCLTHAGTQHQVDCGLRIAQMQLAGKILADNKNVATKADMIQENFHRHAPACPSNPYGDGCAPGRARIALIRVTIGGWE